MFGNVHRLHALIALVHPAPQYRRVKKKLYLGLIVLFKKGPQKARCKPELNFHGNSYSLLMLCALTRQSVCSVNRVRVCWSVKFRCVSLQNSCERQQQQDFTMGKSAAIVEFPRQKGKPTGNNGLFAFV